MASPTLTAALNKSTYAPGETMTLTIAYSDPDNRVDTITVTGTDQSGNPATVTLTTTLADTVTITVSDSAGRTWTRKSHTATQEVWEATA